MFTKSIVPSGFNIIPSFVVFPLGGTMLIGLSHLPVSSESENFGCAMLYAERISISKKDNEKRILFMLLHNRSKDTTKRVIGKKLQVRRAIILRRLKRSDLHLLFH